MSGYIDHGNGTGTDEHTGLMWELHPITTRYTWEDATRIRIADLNAAQLGGYTDWRLPTLQELVSLVDYTRHDPAIDPIFTTVANYYWSATTNADYPYDAWFVYFFNGDVDFAHKGYFYYVRAVRAGSLILRSFDDLQVENARLRSIIARVIVVMDGSWDMLGLGEEEKLRADLYAVAFAVYLDDAPKEETPDA